MSQADDPKRMTLDELHHCCAAQTARFFRQQHHDDRYGFELFRRALVAGDERAWEIIYTEYYPLVAKWVRTHPQFEAAGEEVQYFVNGAFMGLSKACPPEKFDRFSELAGLLSFLKSCVHTAIFNYCRKPRPLTTAPPDESEPEAGPSPSEWVDDQLEREALWGWVNARLRNEKERCVVEYYFGLDFKPREIYVRFPDLFRDVQEIHQVKQNLLERLRRDPEFSNLPGEPA
jgi:hypothetical protein